MNILFVGTYSPPDQDGLHVLSFDHETGRLERLSGIAGITNPSFLAPDAGNNRLFAVSETSDNGYVVALKFDPDKKELVEINRQPTGGGYPCHLSLDANGTWLFCVNYMSGSVCLFPVGEDGVILPLADQVQHTGSGVHPGRQEGPHPHSIVSIPGTDYWLVPDLGTDRLYIYNHDRINGKLRLESEIATEPGAGPRHAAFHPLLPIVYIINELNSTIAAYRYERRTGSLTHIQTVAALPADFQGESTCADIHISSSGEYLYGSNRGHDSIAIYRVLPDARLEQVIVTSAGGRTPRNFVLDPSDGFLLTANQDSNNVVVMKWNDRGVPVSTGHAISLSKPVCLKFFR